MELIDSLEKVRRMEKKPSAVALGFFDGLHTAHRLVIERAVDSKERLLPTVFTFSGGKTGGILSRAQTVCELEKMGVKRVIIPPFAELRNIPAEVFFFELLKKFCDARLIACGYNYCFGKDKLGDTALLEKLCNSDSVNQTELFVLDPILIDGISVSSTRIRKLLSAGDIRTANRLLSYAFYIDEPVINGRGLGNTLGFPTINQAFSGGELLKRGVYATVAEIDEINYKAVTNVGIRPTVTAQTEKMPPVLAETYILDYSGNLYGKRIKVSFFSFIREEKSFSCKEELKAAIKSDVKTSFLLQADE